MSSEALDLAHPAETKERARKALAKHGSIRKAADEAGIPKSTLHRWAKTHQWADPLTSDKDDPGPIEPVDSVQPSSTPPAGEDPAENDIAARQRSQQSNTDTVLDPTSNLPDPHDPLGNGSSPGNLEELDQVNERTTIPHRLYLQAIYRYISLLSSGVQPDRATDAVRSIDPSFYVNPDDHNRIVQALEASGFDPRNLTDYMPDKLEASELSRLRFANPDPPGYVQSIVDAYSLDDAQTEALAQQILAVRQSSYLFGINQQLTALGQAPIGEITDDAVLSSLEKASDLAAQQIADTWARDAASRGGAAWLDLIGSTSHAANAATIGGAKANDRIAALQQEMDTWSQGRAQDKADLIVQSEGADAYHSAVQDFLGNNADLAVSAHVEPDDCVCEGCQDLVDIGEMSIEDAQALDLPLHPGCVHGVKVTYQAQPDLGSLWSAQAA